MKKIDIQTGFANYIPFNFAYILSCDKNSKPSGMIAAWHMKTSHNPPMVVASLHNDHYTKKLIEQSKEFIVAVPDKKLLKAIPIFSEHHGDKIDKFKESKVKTKKAQHLKTPLLADATLNFECKVVESIKTGDHTIFIGEVIAAHQNEGQKILLCYGNDKNDKGIFKEM